MAQGCRARRSVNGGGPAGGSTTAAAGWPWVCANDERGPANLGVPPDPGYEGFDGKAGQGKNAYDLHDIRKLGQPYEQVENDLLAKDGYMDHYVHQYRYDFLNETNIIRMRNRYDSGLTTTALEYTANFILGDLDLDEDWDDYLAELERNGMSRYLAEFAKAPLVDAYLEGRLEY